MTIAQIQIRRGTAAQWTSANPVLGDGEWGLETDTGKTKMGLGSLAWNSLDYFMADELSDIRSQTIIPVADIAARDAAELLYPPTPSSPLYVHRTNAGTGLETEYTIDGVTWYTIFGGPTAFTALPYASGWVDFGAAYQTGRYRKRGDEVKLEGFFKHNTTPATIGTVFTLPAGFRPAAQRHYTIAAGAGWAIVTISTGGVFAIASYISGGSATQVELDMIPAFSTTA